MTRNNLYSNYNVTPLVENRSYIQRSIHGDFINAPAMIFPLASTTMQPMLPLLHRELPRDAGGVINIPGPATKCKRPYKGSTGVITCYTLICG